MANETLGASFAIDVPNLKAGLAQAHRMIRESESEFKAAAAGMDDWRSSSEGVSAKIKSLTKVSELQRAKVEALRAEYDRLIDGGMDPTSKAAIELRTKINNEAASMEQAERQAEELREELRKLKEETGEVSKETEEAEEGIGGLAKAGEIAAGALAAVGAACVAAVGAFFGLAESTREARKLMGQLETSFQTAGHSAEAAEKTFTDLYSIMGDEGAATEAAQQLAKFSSTEKNLERDTRILTGVMAEYGNSIPLEGLAEGMAATAAMGEVQGVLADALEWQGVNLEEFNANLAEMTSEEQRAAYIRSTLTDIYGESADAYRENNAEVIAAQKAQAEMNATLNELGAIAEPVMTTLKQLATDLLQSITPFVSLIGEGLTGALNGADGAADSLAEGLTGIINALLEKIVEMIPFIIDTVVSIVPKLLTALLAQLPTILNTLVSAIVQIINALSAMLPTIVAAIMQVLPQLINALIAAIPQLLQAAVTLLMAIVDALPIIITELINALPSVIETIITAVLDSIPILIDAAIKLFMAILEAVPVIIDALITNLPRIIETIISGIVNAVPQLVQGAIKLFQGIITAIPKFIPQLIKALPQLIKSLVGGLIDGIPQLIKAGADLLAGLFKGLLDPKAIWNAVKGLFNGIVGGIKELFGIHSPSRVMADVVGKNLALGIGVGFEKNIAGVNKQIAGAMNFDGGVGAVGNIGGRAGGGVVVNQYNTYAQAHSRVELYKTKQATAAAVRLAMAGA